MLIKIGDGDDMNGVTFGSFHTINDWDLLMTSKSIGDAEAKTNYIQIPGSDGEKDLTEAFGEVRYNDRTITATFDMFQKPSEWMNLKDEITNYLNGKKLKIIFDKDPNYYYYGRCKVSDFSNSYNVGHITIEAKCEPYKYKINKTSITKTVSSGNTYTYTNDKKTVVPTITSSAAMTISFNGSSYSLTTGDNKLLGIEFKEGNNNIKIVSGSGTLTVTYQEAKL